MKSGKCDFVLPKHDNVNYISIDAGSQFGTIDILGSILKHQNSYEMMKDWISHKDLLKRQFTINSGSEHSELLTFSINDLSRMKGEFLEAYE